MNVLFLGCHCDDIELGCGATIHKYRNVWNITCVTLSSSGPKGKYPELYVTSSKSLEFLGASNIKNMWFETLEFENNREEIWETLFDLNSELSPQIVFTQEIDEQQDHATLYRETLRNFKKSTVLTYRATSRSCPNFHANWYEIVSEQDVAAKIKALEHYDVYIGKKRYFDPEVIRSALVADGVYVESLYAECFRLVKFVSADHKFMG